MRDEWLQVLLRRAPLELLRDAVDITVVAYAIYRILLLVRGTRAAQVGQGLLLIAVVYAISQRLELITTFTLLDRSLTSFLVFVVVIFQADIRRALMRVGDRPFFLRWRKPVDAPAVEEVIAAAEGLAARHIGALFVFERDASVETDAGRGRFDHARRGAEGYFGGPTDLDPQRKQIFDTIEAPILKALRRIKPVRKGDLHTYFDLIPKLSNEVQGPIRKELSDILDQLSSVAIKEAMDSVKLSRLFRMRNLHKLARTNVQVVLNGVTTTPFTRQLSPFNVWLMYVMMTFPNVGYRQGRLAGTTTLANGKVKVAFKDGTSDTFDRVVTRYGPGRGEALIHPTTATEPNGYLLVSPEGLVSRGVTGQYVDLASDAIREARKRLKKRRSSRAIGHYIEKSLYVPMIEAPRRLLPTGEPRAPYDQAALVQLIKDGVRPRFSQFKPW